MGPAPQASYPIGILDSGVGGLSILRALQQEMPRESFIYFGDSLNAPYGAREAAEILRLIRQAAEMLLQRHVKLLVLGSSTLTTVGLADLSSRHAIPVIGTYPAVDRAVAATRSKVVGVLSTRATAHGALLDGLVARFAAPAGVRVLRAWHNDLVPMVERGETDTPALRDVLRDVLGPLAASGADQLVLASTHFTFLQSTIRSEFGGRFDVTDSAGTVAADVSATLKREGLDCPAGASGSTTYVFTGDPDAARAAVAELLNSVAPGQVIAADELDVRAA